MRPRYVEVALAHPRLRLTRKAIRRTVQALDSYYRYRLPPGSLSVAFVTNAVIAEVHATFMDDPTSTDVITFPGDEQEEAGEICISVDYAQRAALRFHSTLEHELNLYLVHGWLHLAGLDDRTLHDKRRMRSGERELLAYLARKKCFLG